MRARSIAQIAANHVPAHERAEVVLDAERILVGAGVHGVEREVGGPGRCRNWDAGHWIGVDDARAGRAGRGIGVSPGCTYVPPHNVARVRRRAQTRSRHIARTGDTIMSRKISFSALESRSARLRLKIRRRPYSGPSLLARGISLMYRRNKTNGHGCSRPATATAPLDQGLCARRRLRRQRRGKSVLTFYQAQDAAGEVGISYELARKRAVAGHIEARREGGRWLVNLTSLRQRFSRSPK